MTFPNRFQHAPSSWKVTAHPNMSCKHLKFQAWERFGEANSEVVMSGDVCVMDVSSFDPSGLHMCHWSISVHVIYARFLCKALGHHTYCLPDDIPNRVTFVVENRL